MSRLSYNELRVGTIFTKNDDPDPYRVIEYAFIRMQQRKPVAQLKIKNLISGKVLNYTAHQNDDFNEIEIESTQVKFIYSSKGEYWFTDPQNPKNRFSLKEDMIGKSGQYLKTNEEIKALKFNDKVIGIELPVKVELKVTEAPPSIKGDTAQGGTKTVTLETGAKIAVPLFINEGDIVRINTEADAYVERVEKA